jgi:hypothetical protein
VEVCVYSGAYSDIQDVTIRSALGSSAEDGVEQENVRY